MFKNQRILLSICFGVLFFIVMLLVVFGKTSSFERMIYDAIISCRNDFFDFYFTTVTKFANTSIIVLVVILFVIIVRNRHALFLVVSSIDCFLLTIIFKHLIGRSRPTELKLIEQGGYSFPSGHTMFAVCVYGYLFYLAITKIKNKVLKYGVSILLFLVILSIGVSRIYVGVHYASDVLAGYFLALFYLFLFIEISKKVHFKKG